MGLQNTFLLKTPRRLEPELAGKDAELLSLIVQHKYKKKHEINMTNPLHLPGGHLIPGGATTNLCLSHQGLNMTGATQNMESDASVSHTSRQAKIILTHDWYIISLATSHTNHLGML